MCDSIEWHYVIAFICIIVFFQILMYKIGFMQGEQLAYKRFTKVCNECRNSCKKCNSSEKSNSWRLT